MPVLRSLAVTPRKTRYKRMVEKQKKRQEQAAEKAMKQAMQIQAPSDVLWKQRKPYEELFSSETALERLLPLYATLAQRGASNTPRYNTGCKGSSPKSL